jgi:hypothetical protein
VSCGIWLLQRAARGGAVPGGVDPADLAAQAVTDFLEGRRRWNREAEPEFLEFLKGVVDSCVSHLATRLENRVSRRIEDDPVTGDLLLEVRGREVDPATLCMDKNALEKFRATILKDVSGDKLAERLFECLDAEITKPSEIAEMLDVTVQEVNNAQKRLRRVVQNVLKKQGRGDPYGRPYTI